MRATVLAIQSSPAPAEAEDAEQHRCLDQARCVVAEYLRDWGLRDPELVALESRRIVNRAASYLSRTSHQIRERPLCETAVRLAVDEIEAWIAQLASGVRGSCLDAKVTTRLPHEVAVHSPDLLRHRNRLPARMLLVLEQSVSPVIPSTRPQQMQPQPRTRLWKILRKGYWRPTRRSAAAMWSTCMDQVRRLRKSR